MRIAPAGYKKANKTNYSIIVINLNFTYSIIIVKCSIGVFVLDDRVLVMMRDFNPWWEDGRVSALDYKRHLFRGIEKFMNTKQVVAIVGLRRVGKTVLLKQLIKDLLETVDEKNVFYFLFDDLAVQKPEALEELLNYYLKTVAGDGLKFVFFDEIQKVPFWQSVLKRFYDSRDDLKFVVSGSASLQIKKSKESLAGRIFDFYMPVLSFREFLELNEVQVEKIKPDFESIRAFYESNIHKKPLFEQLFLEYVFKGAFPEIAREQDEEIIKSYIKNSVTEKIIFEDIPAVFNVRRKDTLYSIMEYCGKETSGLLDIAGLASTLKVNYQTAKSHLFFLENSFVIDLSYNYSKSIAKQLRKSKKVHIAHPCISIALMRQSRKSLEVEELLSKYIETIVFQHSKVCSESIFFWRSPRKEEVDIVMNKETLVPIEVKYKNHISNSDIKNLLKFMEKNNCSKGFIATKNLLKEKQVKGKKILLIPAWLLLLANDSFSGKH